MNKHILKIELIAEWIFLIIWMPFGLLVTFCFLLNPHNKDPLTSITFIIFNIITISLQIGLFTFLIKNIKDTKKFLKQLKEDVSKTSTIPTIHKWAFTFGILEYILWLFILIGIISVFFAISIFAGEVTSPIEVVKSYIITFIIGNFIFLNSTYALIKLPQNKKLNIINIICIICSVVAIISLGTYIFSVNHPA